MAVLLAGKHEEIIAMEQFFLKRQGKVLGPLTRDKIKDLAGRGMVTAEHQISTDRIEWIEAEKVDWLFRQKNVVIDTPAKAKIRTSQSNNYSESELNFESEEETQVFSGEAEDQEENPARVQQPRKTVKKTAENDVSNVSVFSIIWDPVCGLPEVYKRYGDDGSLKIGIGLAVVTLVCFFLGLKELIPTELSTAATNSMPSNKMVEIIITALIPFVSLAAGACIIRFLLGSEKAGGIGGDALIAGAALLPFAVAIIGVVVAKNFETAGQDPRLVGIFLASIAIYLFSAVILILYSGLTRISGIKENLIVFIIPAMVIISSGVSYLLVKQLLQGKI